jgi:hypothetical protein
MNTPRTRYLTVAFPPMLALLLACFSLNSTFGAVQTVNSNIGAIGGVLVIITRYRSDRLFRWLIANQTPI